MKGRIILKIPNYIIFICIFSVFFQFPHFHTIQIQIQTQLYGFGTFSTVVYKDIITWSDNILFKLTLIFC